MQKRSYTGATRLPTPTEFSPKAKFTLRLEDMYKAEKMYDRMKQHYFMSTAVNTGTIALERTVCSEETRRLCNSLYGVDDFVHLVVVPVFPLLLYVFIGTEK